MRKDYKKLFSHLELHEPPAGLFDKIMARIREEERLISIKKRLFFFSTSALASASTFVITLNVFQKEFTQSGFWQFVSLLFSDLNLVMANWEDFWLAIFESLPVMSITASLLTALIFLWSLKHLVAIVQNANIKTQNFDIASR
jgi:hypothetical protein